MEKSRCSYLIGEATISLISDLLVLIIALNMILRNVATHICKNESTVLTCRLDWAEYILNYEIMSCMGINGLNEGSVKRERQEYLLTWTGLVKKVRLKLVTKHLSNRDNHSVGKSMVCNRVEQVVNFRHKNGSV